MIAVIFEVWPADGRRQTYLDIAAELKPELERIDGFLSIERFQSLVDETKLLSLSFWRDEAAVAASPFGAEGRPQRRVARLPPSRGPSAARLRHERARRSADRFTPEQRLDVET
jgi:heme-degrading monooxygenase HmoA